MGLLNLFRPRVPLSPKPPTKTRWSLGIGEGLARERMLATKGRRLQAMQTCEACGGWQAVVDAKLTYQANCQRVAVNPQASEKVRFQASVEWATLENFFAELSRAVTRGQRASKVVATLDRS